MFTPLLPCVLHFKPFCGELYHKLSLMKVQIISHSILGGANVTTLIADKEIHLNIDITDVSSKE